MCGIAGYLIRERDACLEPAVITAMTDAMAHRGPDGEGAWINGPVGLGHRRLAIIDIATGGQPMANEDESLWIICNGEIYNYRELRRDLARHHTLRTQSDKYVVTWDAIMPHLPLLRDYAPLLQDFWRTGLFEDMDRRYFHLIARDAGLDSLLSPDAWAPTGRQACFESFRQVFHGSEAKSYFNRMTHFDLKTLLPALLHVEDRVSMGVGLESRVPLLDHRIAELVTTMPPIMRFEGGRSKHVLREAVADLVPAPVLNRQDKMGFPLPFNSWLRGPIRDFVCDTLLGQAARQRGLYRTDELERQLTKSGKFSRVLWGLLCLELWFQTFIDCRPPALSEPRPARARSSASKPADKTEASAAS